MLFCSLYSSSQWALGFDFSVDGERLNGLVDNLFDVSAFNNLVADTLAQLSVTDSWNAVVPAGDAFVEVDNCLKVYVTGVLSQLDWATVSSAIAATYNTPGSTAGECV